MIDELLDLPVLANGEIGQLRQEVAPVDDLEISSLAGRTWLIVASNSRRRMPPHMVLSVGRRQFDSAAN